MQRSDVIRAWGRILRGRPPSLSIEITTRCPLKCPGCYAYQPEHLAGTPLVSLDDYQDDELVTRFLELVDRHRPMGVHIVGGEPLVRFRELNRILPALSARGVRVEVVTSAVRPIPIEWSRLEGIRVVVSIDGLQPEHDARRKPATYERIQKHIEGHRIIIHSTVTSQMMRRPGYLEEFIRLWSARKEIDQIRISFFTPQVGETSEEILTPVMRREAVAELDRLRHLYPKLVCNEAMLEAYLDPPESPEECIFARVTHCVSADLETVVTPCQLGGNPNCAECGCVASMGLHAVGEHRLAGGPRLATIFDASLKVGAATRWARERLSANGGR